MNDTQARIESILVEQFQPLHLRLRDDSANHAGHAGATSGGGHFKLLVVSTRFDGRTLLERHRMVNEALGELIGGAIHALGMKTLSPSEWDREKPG